MPHGIHIDGDRVGSYPHQSTTVEDRTLSLCDAQSHQLDTTSQEVVHVKAGLQTDDVVGEKAFEYRFADHSGKHLHVPGFRPRNMDEVLHRGVGQC